MCGGFSEAHPQIGEVFLRFDLEGTIRKLFIYRSKSVTLNSSFRVDPYLEIFKWVGAYVEESIMGYLEENGISALWLEKEVS